MRCCTVVRVYNVYTMHVWSTSLHINIADANSSADFFWNVAWQRIKIYRQRITSSGNGRAVELFTEYLIGCMCVPFGDLSIESIK